VSFPESGRIAAEFDSLDFLVVQIVFIPRPQRRSLTSSFLPPSGRERRGNIHKFGASRSKVNRAVQPPGEARTDFDIFLDLAKRLGCYDELFPDGLSPGMPSRNGREFSTGRLCDYSGLDWKSSSNVMVESVARTQQHCRGTTTRLYSDGQFSTEDGKLG